MDLLMSVGYFNEGYRSYMIDPDLTASVLCTGNKVVMTKRISILHHREWSEGVDWHKKIKHEMGGIDNRKIYYEKFRFLQNSLSPSVQLKKRFGNSVGRFLFNGSSESFIRCKLNRRDWINLFGGHFIRLSDPLRTINLPYHLLQQIPLHLLKIGTNPYRYLVE